MAVLPMQKIQILGMKSDLPKVLDYLQEQGMMQVEEVSSEMELEDMEKADHDLDFQIAQLDFAIKFLRDYAPKRPIWAGKPLLTFESALGTVEKSDYKNIVDAAHKLEEDFVADQNELQSLQDERKLLKDWTRLPFDLNTPRETNTVSIFTGSVLKTEFDNLKKELTTMIELSSTEKVKETNQNTLLVCAVSIKHLDEVKVVFNRFKFQAVDLPVHEMSVPERIKEIDQKLIKTQEKLTAHEKTFKDLGQHSENLQIVHDVFVWQRDGHDLHEKLRGTTYSFIVEGWIPTLERKNIEDDLQKISKQTAIQSIKPNKDEEQPILLRNKKAAWPFETVTKLYGFPTASEVDPTPFLATFFIMFFALCLTDAGYGLSLFIIMAVALKFFNLPQESKGLIKQSYFIQHFSFIESGTTTRNAYFFNSIKPAIIYF